jgi:hypothetical protein
VRTSCEDYDLGQDNLDKIYVHLTNNAIQKFSDNYGKFEDGNQISLQELSVITIFQCIYFHSRIILQLKTQRKVSQVMKLKQRLRISTRISLFIHSKQLRGS